MQLAFADSVLRRLADMLPGIGNQQIVDAPVSKRQRRHLDNIDQLARLNDGKIVRLGVERSLEFLT